MRKPPYTRSDLVAAVEQMNGYCEADGLTLRFVVGGEDNMTTIATATPELLAQHCRTRVIYRGTPRQCRQAMYDWRQRNKLP